MPSSSQKSISNQFRTLLIILMFHCFDRQTLQFPKRAAGRVKLLLPIDGAHVVALDEYHTLTKYAIPSGKVVGHLTLPFQPRRLAVTHRLTLMALAVEERAVYEVSVENGRVEQAAAFPPSHHFNTQQVKQREREYFSTMTLACFLGRQACLLREERADERRLRLHFLSKGQEGWKATFNELALNGAIAEKADEKSRVAVWRQEVSRVGEFEFCAVDLETMRQESVAVRADALTLFTIVKAMRATPDGWLLCLNHRHPQLLFFSNTNGTRVRNTPTNLLWIANANPDFILSLCLSEDEKSLGRIDLTTPEGERMDSVETTGEEVAVSVDQQLLAEFDREQKDSGWICLRAIRILRKEKLYLNMLQKISGSTLTDAFMRDVLSLLR